MFYCLNGAPLITDYTTHSRPHSLTIFEQLIQLYCSRTFSRLLLTVRWLTEDPSCRERNTSATVLSSTFPSQKSVRFITPNMLWYAGDSGAIFSQENRRLAFFQSRIFFNSWSLALSSAAQTSTYYCGYGYCFLLHSATMQALSKHDLLERASALGCLVSSLCLISKLYSCNCCNHSAT